MAAPDFDVAIIGYGPVGATLANLLGMSGLKVVVLEREPSVYHLPRAVSLDGEGMRLFQTMGLAERLLPKLNVSRNIRHVNTEGKLLGIYRLKGARCRDWEDIAIGPGPDPQRSYLYVGDIGDNQAKYPSITIYRVPEPAVDPNRGLSETQIGPVDAIELTYPDGPKDAETLLVDPLNGDMYVIAKREFFCRIYRSPHPQLTTKRTVMKLAATLPWGFAVGGDVSPDGQWVIIRGPFSASLWRRPEGEDLCRAFSTEGFRLALMPEPQGEGICFDGDGRGYFTIGEQLHPPIYYFARTSSSQKSDAEPSD